MTNIGAIWPSIELRDRRKSCPEIGENAEMHIMDKDSSLLDGGEGAPTHTVLNAPLDITESAPPHITSNGKNNRRPHDAREDSYAHGSGKRTIDKISHDIAQLEKHIVDVEKGIEEVIEASRTGQEYRGERDQALVKEKARLVRKEHQLREEKQQLREEKIVFLKASFRTQGANHVNSEGARPRLSFIMTSACVDDPEGAKEEKKRRSLVEQLETGRHASMDRHKMGDLAGTDIVANVYKLEEDPRLLTKLSSFESPIMVSTLLAGFSLVLFDVAETEISRQLAILSFGLDISASMVLSLISFRGQQLYACATDVKPLVRKFIRRMQLLIVFALVAFSLGIVTFVVSFLLEASEEMDKSWMWLLGLTLTPTIIAGMLFFVSTIEVRRHSSLPTE